MIFPKYKRNFELCKENIKLKIKNIITTENAKAQHREPNSTIFPQISLKSRLRTAIANRSTKHTLNFIGSWKNKTMKTNHDQRTLPVLRKPRRVATPTQTLRAGYTTSRHHCPRREIFNSSIFRRGRWNKQTHSPRVHTSQC